MLWFENLKKWLGIKDSIHIFNTDTRGCYSSNLIKSFQPIVKIKSKYFIEYSKIIKLFDDLDELEFVNSLVAFYLMIQDTDPNSPIKPYLDSLPNNTSEFNLDKNQMEKLVRGEEYLNHLNNLEIDGLILYEYNLLHQLILGLYTYDDFYSKYIHYRYLVGSRIFGYEHEKQLQSGLVPYIDMFNHSFEPNSMWSYEEETSTFVLRAIKSINPGEEILDHYGNQCNFNLLVYYGFVINSNPYINLQIENVELNEQISITKIHLDEQNILIKKTALKYLNSHKQIIKKISNSNILRLYLDEITLLKQLI